MGDKLSYTTGLLYAVKPKIQGEDKRNIMFKPCNRDVKQNILKSCKVVKPKKFYINESLTPLRNTVLYVMRNIRTILYVKRNIRA